MKFIEKYKYWLIGAGVVLAIWAWYYFVYLPGSITATGDSTPGSNSFAGPNDQLAFNQIVSAIEQSPIGNINYTLATYDAQFAPGKQLAPTSPEGTVNGIQTATGGLMQTLWTGTLGAFSTNLQNPSAPPTAGHTQAQAQAAYALGQQAYQIFESYQQNALLSGQL